jgi:hypothetical protein
MKMNPTGKSRRRAIRAALCLFTLSVIPAHTFAQATGKGQSLLETMTWNGSIPVIRDGAGLMLQSAPREEPRFQSKESFAPPFTLTVRFIPNQRETRLYYGAGMFIFGWDNEPPQLRVHSPLTHSPKPFPNKAPKPGKQTEFVMKIGAKRMTASIGGAQFYSETGDFTKINPTPIEIGPCFGNKVTVVSMTVTKG